MASISIEKVLTVKNYEAGKKGNRLVFIDEDLKIVTYKPEKGKDRHVTPLICGAYIYNSDDQSRIAKKCDGNTDYTSVIVVSKRFKHLLNKEQLALLAAENERLDLGEKVSVYEQTTVLETLEAVNVSGKFFAKRALKKRDDMLRNQSVRMGGKYRKDVKAHDKVYALKRLEIPSCGSCEDMFDDVEEDEADTTSSSSTSSAGPAPAGA